MRGDMAKGDGQKKRGDNAKGRRTKKEWRKGEGAKGERTFTNDHRQFTTISYSATKKANPLRLAGFVIP